MLFSLRQQQQRQEFGEEEIPLVSQITGRDLEVAEGVNLDSDTELEAALQPQIRPRTGTGASRGWGAGRSRPSSVSSAKLKYQSEIRNLIASHQVYSDGNDDDDDDDNDDDNNDDDDDDDNDSQSDRLSSESGL